MFVKIEDGKIIGSSNVKIDESYIEKEITEDELTEQLKSQKIQEIDNQIKAKILEKYSDSDQVNLQRKAQRISSECFFEKRDPTKDEMAILIEAKKADDYINSCIEEGITLKDNLNLGIS